jgi:hypothetical protein
MAPHSDLVRYEARDAAPEELAGFLVFSRISRICLAFNVLLDDPRHPDSFRALVPEGARIALDLGYPFLNVQGSQDLAQYVSRRKLRPVAGLAKTHLVSSAGFRQRRKAIYSQIQKMMWENSFSIPGMQVVDMYGVSNRVAWKPRPDEMIWAKEMKPRTS